MGAYSVQNEVCYSEAPPSLKAKSSKSKILSDHINQVTERNKIIEMAQKITLPPILEGQNQDPINDGRSVSRQKRQEQITKSKLKNSVKMKKS